MSNETHAVPIWVVPGRVKAGEVLPLDASAEAIETAAINAAFTTVELAHDGDVELVFPTARVTIEPHWDNDGEQDGLTVQAWCQIAERS